jgi:hypothetical protein
MACKCVSCVTCRGSGHTWRWDELICGEESERCEDCDGSGLTEECDECMDARERENDYL